MKKLMIFGDSIIKGVTYSGQSYHLCQDHDFDTIAAQGVTVENYARMGATIDAGLKQIDRRLAPCAEDTTVLFCFGGNDCDFDWAAVARAPSVKHIPKTSLDAFEKMLVDSIEKIKKRGAMPVVCTTPPINPQKYFSNVICTVADGSKVMEFLNGDLTNISRYHECYNLAIVKCALENNCRLIDLRTPLLLDRKYMDLLCPDGIHPNEQGHMLMAKVVENIIDGMLKRSASGK